ncbi:transposase [Enterococcus hirae]
MILEIYTSSQKRLGTAKIQRILLRDYGISISIGRVYRLMKSMNLPKMSTVKPVFKKEKTRFL